MCMCMCMCMFMFMFMFMFHVSCFMFMLYEYIKDYHAKNRDRSGLLVRSLRVALMNLLQGWGGRAVSGAGHRCRRAATTLARATAPPAEVCTPSSRRYLRHVSTEAGQPGHAPRLRSSQPRQGSAGSVAAIARATATIRGCTYAPTAACHRRGCVRVQSRACRCMAGSRSHLRAQHFGADRRAMIG